MEPSYASGTSSKPLLGDTIGDNLDRTIARFGEREALVSVHQDLRYTYEQFGAAVERAARAFLAAGLESGDRVGIWSPNCAEWALVQYATAKLGVILVNINPAYRTSELEYALRQSGCRMLVAATAFKTSDYVAMVDEVRPSLPELERVVFIGRDWDEFLAEGESVGAGAVAERQAATQFDDPINIQYTSGTTGFPKGATLSHHNILNNGYFVGLGCGYSEQDRVCIPVPFYHCFGMVMGNLSCTAHGACMVIPAPAFDAEATLRAVQDERCTSLYGVPTMFIAELEHAELRRLRPLEPAHRHHGRLAVPDRDDAARRVADAHGRGDDLLRHDRDLAGVDADRRRRHDGAARRDGRAHAPAPGDQDRLA